MHTSPQNPHHRRADPELASDIAKGNEISLAVDQIRSTHRSVRDAEREAVRQATACGRLLIEAKHRVGDREWPRWVQEHSGFQLSKAEFYTKLARYVEDDAKASQIENLRLAEIEILLATQRAA